MKPLVRSLLCPALFALPVLGTVQPAVAQVSDLTCPVTVTLGLNPGLALIPQTQTVTGVLKLGTEVSSATPCTSVTGAPYHGASGSVTGTGTMGCVGGNLSGTADVTWNNGDTSTATWSLTALPPVPVFNAMVTGGGLAGSTVLAAGIPTGFSGNCLLAPWTSISGAGVLAFIRP